MSRLMRSTETMLRDIVGAPIVSENKSAAANADDAAYQYFATGDIQYTDGEPWFYRFRTTSHDCECGEYTADYGKTWKPARCTLGHVKTAYGYVPSKFSELARARDCAVMSKICDLFDKLDIDAQQQFLADLWSSDNAAFSDDLCETIADAWRRGR